MTFFQPRMCVWVQISLFLQGCQSYWIGTDHNLVWPHLNLLTSAKTQKVHTPRLWLDITFGGHYPTMCTYRSPSSLIGREQWWYAWGRTCGQGWRHYLGRRRTAKVFLGVCSWGPWCGRQWQGGRNPEKKHHPIYFGLGWCFLTISQILHISTLPTKLTKLKGAWWVSYCPSKGRGNSAPLLLEHGGQELLWGCVSKPHTDT